MKLTTALIFCIVTSTAQAGQKIKFDRLGAGANDCTAISEQLKSRGYKSDSRYASAYTTQTLEGNGKIIFLHCFIGEGEITTPEEQKVKQDVWHAEREAQRIANETRTKEFLDRNGF